MTQPDPTTITKARNNARITQSAAAAMVHSSLRTWQSWEAGTAKMHPAIWRLFRILLDHGSDFK